MKATLMENKAPFRLYNGYHLSEFPEISHLAVPAHALQALYVWLRSVNNEGHFTWRTMYFSCYISPSLGGFFLNSFLARATNF
jgi:hypothetical protein